MTQDQGLIAPSSGSDPGAEDEPRSILRFLKELPVLVALALAIALLIKAFLVQAFYIPSASMEPTLRQGDRVLVNKLSYRFGDPERGNVVVFEDPFPDPCEDRERTDLPDRCNRNVLRSVFGWFADIFGLPTSDTRDFIKRIVGLPGETLQIRDGKVFVCDSPCTPLGEDGSPVDGQQVDLPSSEDEGPQLDDANFPLGDRPYEIGPDEYFVMGDNRANSSDSRTFEAIPRDIVIGKAFVLVWPPTRFNGL